MMAAGDKTSVDAISRTGHTLTDKVEAVLRDQLISGTRAPGERLNEVEIAAELDVSRGPVREAMQRLARDGLIRIESHRGAFVRVLDSGEVRDLFEVRTSLEAQAAGLAARRAGVEEVAQLRAMLDEVGGAIDRDPARRYPESLDLHAQIVQYTRNGALMRYLNSTNQELKLVRARSGFLAIRAPEALEEHRRIVEAIAARDPDAAAAAMTIHMQSALQTTLGLLRSQTEKTP